MHGGRSLSGERERDSTTCRRSRPIEKRAISLCVQKRLSEKQVLSQFLFTSVLEARHAEPGQVAFATTTCRTWMFFQSCGSATVAQAGGEETDSQHSSSAGASEQNKHIDTNSKRFMINSTVGTWRCTTTGASTICSLSCDDSQLLFVHSESV